MSFIQVLKSLTKVFFHRPVKRDISGLDSAVGQDDVFETVATHGGPLKDKQLRKAWRDPRLLPKKKPVDLLGRRKKYFENQEARRLFSATLLTKNRDIRDLSTDREQLERYGLPLWETEIDLAEALGLTVKQLRHFSIHRQKELVFHYVSFRIPKKNGSMRIIMAPKKKLKKIQRDLVRQLVQKLPVSDYAHGFRKGRSIRTGALDHVGRQVVIHLDLKDFFPSVHYARIRGLLISLGYGYPVATTLSVLMTEAVRQPVEMDGRIYHVPVGPRHCVPGAPTSPGLCNAVTMKMDHRLAGLARSLGFAYSRYADDLSFSGDQRENLKKLLWASRKIISEEGFEINPQKTRIMRQGRRQTVTGVVVNQDLGLSRKQRRKIRAEIHQTSLLVQKGQTHPEQLARIKGQLAYLAMLNPGQAEKLKPDFI